jgi:hypothetical protein
MLTPIVPPPAQFQTVPNVEDMAGVEDGAEIQTPMGVGKKVNGDLGDEFRLSPEGKEQYRAAKVKRMASYGKWPHMDDPRAPQPNVEPGKTAYNPFAPSGQEWSK